MLRFEDATAVISDLPSNYAFCKRNDKWVLALKKPYAIEIKNLDTGTYFTRVETNHKYPNERFIRILSFEFTFKNKIGKFEKMCVPENLILGLGSHLFESIKSWFVLDDEGLSIEELPMLDIQKLSSMTRGDQIFFRRIHGNLK